MRCMVQVLSEMRWCINIPIINGTFYCKFYFDVISCEYDLNGSLTNCPCKTSERLCHTSVLSIIIIKKKETVMMRIINQRVFSFHIFLKHGKLQFDRLFVIEMCVKFLLHHKLNMKVHCISDGVVYIFVIMCNCVVCVSVKQNFSKKRGNEENFKLLRF